MRFTVYVSWSCPVETHERAPVSFAQGAHEGGEADAGDASGVGEDGGESYGVNPDPAFSPGTGAVDFIHGFHCCLHIPAGVLITEDIEADFFLGIVKGSDGHGDAFHRAAVVSGIQRPRYWGNM